MSGIKGENVMKLIKAAVGIGIFIIFSVLILSENIDKNTVHYVENQSGKVLISTDLGYSWNAKNNIETHNLIRILEKIGDDEIIYSNDGGKSWQKLPIAKNSMNLELFPQPATEFLRISSNNLEDLNYRIFDLKGKEVLSGYITLNGNETISISIGELNDGIYFFEYTIEKESFINKFIKH
jgi:hypothetical protein